VNDVGLGEATLGMEQQAAAAPPDVRLAVPEDWRLEPT